MRQEIFARLIVYHATRELLAEAARLTQSQAERTSFVRALQRRPPLGNRTVRLFPPRHDDVTAISTSPRSAALLPPRRSRDCPRRIKLRITPFGSKTLGELASSRPPPAVVTLNHRWHDH